MELARFWDDKAYQRAQALAEEHKLIIACLCAGEQPTKIPWDDAHFQRMMLALIREMLDYKRDAEKLAVIREVFRGR